MTKLNICFPLAEGDGELTTKLTHIQILWIRQRVENRTRFRRIKRQHIINQHRPVASGIIGFLRWASNKYGTVLPRIDLLRAAVPNERYITVANVHRGGEGLLCASGRPTVEKVLETIEAVEALGSDPADVAPEYWDVHNRLLAGQRPKPYTKGLHRAWLRRKRGDVMISRAATLATVTLAIIAILTTRSPTTPPRLVWNVSTSAPTGLYRIRPVYDLTIATLVIAYPPEPLAAWLAEGRYLPRGVPLLKSVVALKGQAVCRIGLVITVDGRQIGVAQKQDHIGRSLPVWQGCRIIDADEIFLMNPNEPASLDGRYFGPIPITAIAGRAEPLWTSKEG